MRRTPAADDTGAVAVIVALVMTLSLILAAFAVDIGNAYAQGRQLAVSADAAALAAARKVGEAYAQPTCTTAGLAAIGADALALAEAQAVEASNRRSGATGDTVTAHAYCSTDATAILVDVTTARDIATGLAGVTGITQSHPNAKATGRWQRSLIGTIRPWAVCQTTIA
ncbi:MAG TPA: pilus assembly protein TadG-related protein, partial [Candidatus Nanopelagicales bacterium]|nr:pilus assembly protein TadG-related protein [Candidatus Nanopelagicales bacterium]